MNLLLIDNYDSFTYNLYQAFLVLNASVTVIRNDNPELEKDLSNFDAIVISPGPGGPDDAGLSREIIRKYGDKTPILGVCLGMQCINEVYGGRTIKAPVCVHGKTSAVHHIGKGLYEDVPSPFDGARYHSLVVDHVPECLQLESWTEDGVPMGIRHVSHPIVGVQFHPESFLTELGDRLLERFLEGNF